MTPNLAFWTFAFFCYAAAVGLACRGWWQVRRGDRQAHRRAMNGAVVLIVIFVVAYGVKLALLGHEDRSNWRHGENLVLYIHETAVATMLLAGGAARWLGNRPRSTRRHAMFGRVALVAAIGGFLTASVVLGVLFRHASSDAVRSQTVSVVDGAATR